MVYEVTGSGALLGAVLGVRALPLVLLAPLSGVAADRFNRKRLLQTSQALAALVSFAVGAALALGLISTWMLFAFTVLMGASNVIDRPARFTTAFELVPREAAVKAVALNTIGFSLMRVLGPGLAGYLIAWFGAGWHISVRQEYLLVPSVKEQSEIRAFLHFQPVIGAYSNHGTKVQYRKYYLLQSVYQLFANPNN